MLGRMYAEPRGHAAGHRVARARGGSAGADAEEGRALLYDLGVVLDEAGETARALAVFLELQADAGDYRDVPARIDRLARVQSGG